MTGVMPFDVGSIDSDATGIDTVSSMSNQGRRSSFVQGVNNTGHKLKGFVSRALNHHREENTKKMSGTTKIKIFVGLLLVVFLLIFMFYPNLEDNFAVSNSDGKTPKELNGFYYWTTLTSTVGFGDICPKTWHAKLVTSMYQILLILISMGGIWYFTDGRLKKMMKAINRKNDCSPSITSPYPTGRISVLPGRENRRRI